MTVSSYNLLVVDNGNLATLLNSRESELLDNLNIKLVTSVEEALEVLEQSVFDAIICCDDLGDNNLKGIDLLQWIRHSGGKTPFFMISEIADSELAIRTSTLGANLFLRRDIEEHDDVFNELLNYVLESMKSKNESDLVRRKELDFRNLFESSMDGILATDLKGTIVECNKSFIEMIGSDDVIGKSFENYVPPDLLSIAQQIGLQVQKVGQSEPIEYELHTTEGLRTPVLLSAWRRDDPDGIPIGSWIWIHDLSKQKMVEEKVAQSDARFHSIFSDSPIAIAITDKEGKLTDMNEECMRMFGIKDLDTIQRYDIFDDPDLKDETKVALNEGKKVKFFVNYSFDHILEENIYETTRKGEVQFEVRAGPLHHENHSEIIGYVFQIIEHSDS